MALILCLETSSKNCSVAISKDGETIFSRDRFDEDYCHGEQLHPLINDLLFDSKYSMEDFDAFALSAGPGSYTGLRIGAASVKGLSFALDKAVISISTLKSMLLGFKESDPIKGNEYDLFCPILDSRKDEVYLAIYDSEYNEIVSPCACNIYSFDFKNHLQTNKMCLFGPGSYKFEPILKHNDIVFLNKNYPSARFLGSLAEFKYKNKDFVDTAYFEPMYLKPFMPTLKKKI